MVKRTLSIAVLAMAIIAFSTPNDAQAQRQDVGQKTFGNLIAALNNVNAQLRALENVDVEIEEVRVVNISDIEETLNENQIEVLNNALQNADILTFQESLQNILNENEVLNSAFQDIVISDVVAVNVLSGGDLVIFTQPE